MRNIWIVKTSFSRSGVMETFRTEFLEEIAKRAEIKGELEQSIISFSLEEDKRAALGKHTKSIDMDVTSRKEYCTAEIKRATELEARMTKALTENSVKWLCAATH